MAAPARGVKVVWLPHAEQLTEQAANALLKTLEEPPEDTYFLLVCETPARLLPTLRSRCLYWPLPAPNEALGLRWLRQAGFDDSLSACTALRLCANAPLAAEALLQPARWPAGVLHAQWQQWLLCLRQCQEISGVNRELLLTHHLLNWEQGVAHTYASQ